MRPVDKDRELMIRDLSVVDDPSRTLEPCDFIGHSGPGPQELPVWSFGNIMTAIAQQAGVDPSDFVLRWLQSWNQDQTVNGFFVPARDRMQLLITDQWLAASGGTSLDLSKAPFRLAAIVNRMDLRRSDGMRPLDAGEARFVFNAVDPFNCARIEFMLIFEFKLQASNVHKVLAWARDWHHLGDLEFGPDFNAALQSLTDRFVQSFAQARIGEIAITFFDWDFRTFVASQGELVLTTLPNTPDISFNETPELASYVNAHAAEILNETHEVPLDMLGGYTIGSFFWDSQQIADRLEVRHHFGVQTCNGCHAAETGTRFLQVAPRREHEIADLSDFLTGENMPISDPLDQLRTFNELQRRADLLQQLLQHRYLPPLAVRPAH
jgi:hypothetical protein